MGSTMSISSQKSHQHSHPPPRKSSESLRTEEVESDPSTSTEDEFFDDDEEDMEQNLDFAFPISTQGQARQITPVLQTSENQTRNLDEPTKSYTAFEEHTAVQTGITCADTESIYSESMIATVKTTQNSNEPSANKICTTFEKRIRTGSQVEYSYQNKEQTQKRRRGRPCNQPDHEIQETCSSMLHIPLHSLEFKNSYYLKGLAQLSEDTFQLQDSTQPNKFIMEEDTPMDTSSKDIQSIKLSTRVDSQESFENVLASSSYSKSSTSSDSTSTLSTSSSDCSRSFLTNSTSVNSTDNSHYCCTHHLTQTNSDSDVMKDCQELVKQEHPLNHQEPTPKLCPNIPLSEIPQSNSIAEPTESIANNSKKVTSDNFKISRRIALSARSPAPLTSEHFDPRPLSLQLYEGGEPRANRWPTVSLKPGHFLDNRYLLLHHLGSGAFSNVIRAKHVVNRRSVAIKVFTRVSHASNARCEIQILKHLHKSSIDNGTTVDNHASQADETKAQLMEPETIFSNSVDTTTEQNKKVHEQKSATKISSGKGLSNLVQMLDYFSLSGQCYEQWFIVFESLSFSLYDLLRKNHFRPLSVQWIAEIGAQLCSALAYVHDRKLIHTDIKPENVLLCEPPVQEENGNLLLINKRIKLIDFGLARWSHEPSLATVTTRYYRAPEVVLKLDWDCAIDLWSVGCTLFELYDGHTLFEKTRSNLQHVYMMSCILNPLPESMRYNRPDYFKVIDRRLRQPKLQHQPDFAPLHARRRGEQGDEQLFDLMWKMLEFEPKRRISAESATYHPFLRPYLLNP